MRNFAHTLTPLLTVALFSTGHAEPKQEALALFDAPVVVVGDQFQFENLIDWNNDGYMDVVSCWWWDDQYNGMDVDFFINDRQGGFVKGPGTNIQVTPTTAWHDSAVGDVDGDGDQDLIYARGKLARLFLSAGDGSTAGAISFSLPSEIRALTLCDLDLDGDLDLVVAEANSLSRFKNLGANQWTLVAASPTDGEVIKLETVDADGAGGRDLVVTTPTHVQVLITRGFAVAPLFSFPHSEVTPMMTVGDIDSDGDEDIVLFDVADYLVIRQEPAGVFTREPPVVGGPAWSLFDVDADGDLDGICCGGGGPSSVKNRINSTFHVSLNDGSGRFAVAQTLPGLGAEHIAGAADLDHDGDVDLVAGRVVYYSRGGDGFALPPELASERVTAEAIGDHDTDGDPDVDLGLRSVKRNLGDGESRESAAVMPDPPAGSCFVGPGFPGDFDGDGDLDLIVKRCTDAGAFLNMQLLCNTGGGGFVDGGPAAGPGVAMTYFTAPNPDPRHCIVADMDGDGDLDLCSLPPGTTWSASRYFWNDGHGFFSAGELVSDWRLQGVADFNADGLPDLLVVLQSSAGWAGGLAVRFGLGNQIFSPPTSSVGSGFNGRFDSADIADMDNDGDLDVCAAEVHGHIYIASNDGTGQFNVVMVDHDALGKANGVPDRSRGLLAVDANVDGIMDLIGWGAEYYDPDKSPCSAYVYPGLGGLAFGAPCEQVMVPTATADADGDGDIDVYSTHLHRSAHFGPTSGGSRRQLDEGVPGMLGMAPVLGAQGPFRAGETISVSLTGGLGGASARISYVFLEDDPGLMERPRYFFQALGGPSGAAGSGACEQVLLVPPTGWTGRTLEFTARVVDPNAPNGESASNRLRLTFGD